MLTVTVNASKKYDILIGGGLLSRSGEIVRYLYRCKTAVVVTDDNVARFHLSKVTQSFESAGYQVLTYVIPHGEASKSREQYFAILDFLAENRVTRTDLLVALGGGVVGDLTGFAAATYLRGIKFIQMPTTVLAAVDSSVGGKTGIDIPEGKNLVGAFYQPILVICDTLTLNTLPESVYDDGCAEIIKYGCIADAELFEWLKAPIRPQIDRVIERCVSIKRDIVNQDERDTGIRATLNFGHTIGHAIEKASNFTITHGQAVATGMVMIANAMCRLGKASEATYEAIRDMVAAYRLPVKTSFTEEELYDTMTTDKKRSGDRLRFIIVKEIGSCEYLDVRVEDSEEGITLRKVLKEALK